MGMATRTACAEALTEAHQIAEVHRPGPVSHRANSNRTGARVSLAMTYMQRLRPVRASRMGGLETEMSTATTTVGAGS